MMNERLQELCKAVVKQAVIDYRKALEGWKIENVPSHIAINECENFFRSEHFSLFTQLDGEYLITEIRKEFTRKR